MKDSISNPETEKLNSGIGATFKSLREAKQYSLADASARLKFSQRQINALENEQWDLLPTGMSLRGLVRNYARYLETDVDSILSILDSQLGSSATKVTKLDAPIKYHPDPNAPKLESSDELPRKPWGWLLLILVLLIVAFFYAIDSGWIPDSWLIFDWLKMLR